MKKRLEQLLSLPYRLWMLALDKHMLCSDCGTIVSGGFGYRNDDGVNRFSCMSCTQDKHRTGKNRANLSRCAGLDPNKKESD